MRDKDTGQREVRGGVIDQNISILIDICTIVSYDIMIYIYIYIYIYDIYDIYTDVAVICSLCECWRHLKSSQVSLDSVWSWLHL